MKSKFNFTIININQSILYLFLFVFIALISCNKNSETLTPKQSTAVQESVRMMTESISRELSVDGPIAWLKYFEITPAFFMASDGQVVFQNNDAASNFIKNALVKNLHLIDLQWNNLRIDPLSEKQAIVAADVHENLTDFSGVKTPYNGYFTGLAEKTSNGWQFRNLHWSVNKSK